MENVAWWQQKKKKEHIWLLYQIPYKHKMQKMDFLKMYIIFAGKKNFLPPSHLMMGFSFLFKVFVFFFFPWFLLVWPNVPPMKRTVSVGRWVLCLETSGWTKSQSAGWRHGDTGKLYKWTHIRRNGTTR